MVGPRKKVRAADPPADLLHLLQILHGGMVASGAVHADARLDQRRHETAHLLEPLFGRGGPHHLRIFRRVGAGDFHDHRQSAVPVRAGGVAPLLVQTDEAPHGVARVQPVRHEHERRAVPPLPDRDQCLLDGGPGGRRQGFRVRAPEADVPRVDVLVVEPVHPVDDLGRRDRRGLVVGQGLVGGVGGETVAGAALPHRRHRVARSFVVGLDHRRLLGDPDDSAPQGASHRG
mmetsp:Transcript_27468/g.54948  ORF Transcript_27468/g.54948 Transcript_27468/m.54948 type:complete len:231 (-) Transcript_27468:75-767(-)